MDLISTHVAADFDALASMLAASKLYPQARLLFPGSQERNVREFLAHAPLPLLFERLRGFPLERVTRLILVDVKRVSRIGPLKDLAARPGLEVHIYDHHPAHPKDLHGPVEVLREVGATATIMVGLLRERGIPLSPLEATVLALGIYEETGCLTYTSTRSEDLEAAAYLVAQGANLTTVSDCIRRELRAEQIALLNQLVTGAERYTINGIPVVISTAALDRYVGDLAMVAGKLRDAENLNVLVVLVRMDERIHLVARSRLDAADAAEIAHAFGGGGHHSAASASIKGLTLEEAKARLLAHLKGHLRPRKVARDLMSAARTIGEGASLGEAAQVMHRLNLVALPVVRRGEVVGLLTREVVDKALYHRLGEAPVRDYMAPEVPRIGPETPLSEVHRVMAERNLRLLPVVQDGGRLVGTVTRGDILRHLYQDMLRRPAFLEAEEPEATHLAARNVGALLQARLPGWLNALLRAAGQVADAEGTRAYVVGGFVRDLLLGVENLDVDLVVEGDGIAFAETLVKRLGGRCTSHRTFGTAAIILPDGFKLDVASARAEYYEYPAALPTVEHSSIKMDLARRDFSINALAICLNAGAWGRLLDFFGGQRDLKDRCVRVLHALSFVEDPTRILRAVRFTVRYGFHLGRQEEHLVANAVRLGLPGRLAGPRVLNELRLIFAERDPLAILQRLQTLGVLRAIHPALEPGRGAEAASRRLAEVPAAAGAPGAGARPQRWQLWLLALLADRRPAEVRAALRRLQPPPRAAAKLLKDAADFRRLRRTLGRRQTYRPSAVARLLRAVSPEVATLLAARADREELRAALADHLMRGAHLRPALAGRDLQALGIRPGPVYRAILDTLRDARLDGRVRTREDELALVRRRFHPAMSNEG
jgi:tRNA nucleotidyltransferase (CCA-adding enzyme)